MGIEDGFTKVRPLTAPISHEQIVLILQEAIKLEELYGYVKDKEVKSAEAIISVQDTSNREHMRLVAMQNEIDAANGEINRLRLDCERCDSMYKASQVKFETIQNKYNATLREIDALHIEIMSLQAGILDYQNSTSWRITKPLRAIGRISRKLTQRKV